jgi:hypothetical protein
VLGDPAGDAWPGRRSGRRGLQEASHKNRARSIVLAKGGRRWVFEYLFAKKDRENISQDELAQFRLLAKTYEALTAQQLARLIQDKDWVEICHGG